jgi:hypothetical protein
LDLSKNSTLKELEILNFNNFKFPKNLKKLKCINIKILHIFSKEDINEIFSLKYLEKLSLCSMNNLDKGFYFYDNLDFDYFLELLSKNEIINNLNFDKVFKDKSHNFTNFFEYLENNTKIKTLRMINDSLDSSSLEFLFTKLKNNNTLTKLNISGNNFENVDSISLILNYLKNNNTLKSINFQNLRINLINNEFVWIKKIFNSLKNNNSLNYLFYGSTKNYDIQNLHLFKLYFPFLKKLNIFKINDKLPPISIFNFEIFDINLIFDKI